MSSQAKKTAAAQTPQPDNEKRILPKKVIPVPKPQVPKSYRLDLDEKAAHEVERFIHNNFIGAIADPIIEKFGLLNPPVSLSGEDLQKAIVWLDMNFVGKVRVPIVQILQKHIREEVQDGNDKNGDAGE